MVNPNFQLLVDAAKLLKPILEELVFVGGCTTALLITDKAAAVVRPTYDVDAIAEITSYVGHAQFSERLKALGFREDTREGAPLCRWCQQTTTLDVMPLDGRILGFKNIWYGPKALYQLFSVRLSQTAGPVPAGQDGQARRRSNRHVS